MREFSKSLLYVFVTQIVCWGIFILCDELVDEGLALILGVVFAISVFILYFVCVKKIIDKNKLNSIRFNVFLNFLWVGFSILHTSILLYLVDKGILHYCEPIGWSCFLNGLEYAMHGILLIIISVMIVLWKAFNGIYNFFKIK